MLNAKVWLAPALLGVMLAGCGGSDSDDDSTGDPVGEAESFHYVEGTIAQARAALQAGDLTCEDMVQGYLDRIEAYDRQGPSLQSVIAVNPSALDEARDLDSRYAAEGFQGPLHCVTVLLKDNFDTVDMPTTAGGLALETSQPPDDAFSVARLRDAGAIIIGKANLDEYAFGFRGSSSVGGQVRNAYDPTKGPGGSSSGTGSSIAASFAMVGTGSDTGGSIRVPSSLHGLVGIRPSLRLISQDGIVPLAHWQDTGGPMCRTVEDCALTLSAMVGYDPGAFSGQRFRFDHDADLMTSPFEYQLATLAPSSYTKYLDGDALSGARIGVVRDLFGDGQGENAEVQRVIEAALERMRAAGATVEDVTIPDLSTILSDYRSVSRYEFKTNLTEYLASWPSTTDGHPRSFEEVYQSGGYESRNAGTFAFYDSAGTDLENNADYLKNINERPDYVRQRFLAALENIDASGRPAGEPFDVLLYPSVLSLAPDVGGSPSAGSNNRLSPFSGFPALTMPAGMADTDPALPVGMEMLAREFDEGTLIKLAYAYQELAEPRQAPTFTPELEEQPEPAPVALID
ncbi:amidase [Alcanivorax sp. 521-1]|uniref:Amidase n=1 Tax=Alloalcanivorax profundimaris TaxID=2735259 RepID=A0ABS0ARA4_9GAMM|nr:amidase family protein [Alloalcanivorax profundimaris]MBF5056636.1 amidase [Alloalcanivorax profundimaris]